MSVCFFPFFFFSTLMRHQASQVEWWNGSHLQQNINYYLIPQILSLFPRRLPPRRTQHDGKDKWRIINKLNILSTHTARSSHVFFMHAQLNSRPHLFHTTPQLSPHVYPHTHDDVWLCWLTVKSLEEKCRLTRSRSYERYVLIKLVERSLFVAPSPHFCPRINAN